MINVLAALYDRYEDAGQQTKRLKRMRTSSSESTLDLRTKLERIQGAKMRVREAWLIQKLDEGQQFYF